jgi:hypothetical protein
MYAWDYLGGIVDTDSIGSHLFSQAGLNQIALVAQNTFGCSDTAQYTFNVSAAPNSIFAINNSCEQTIVTPVNSSIANDSTGIQSVLWNFGNGSNSTTFNAPCFYASSGNYSVSLICYAGNGCTDTSTQVVTIHPMPELNWNLAPACKDNPTVFSSSSTIPSGSIDSTFWLVNLQYPFTGIEGQFTFSTLGIQFLTLSAVSNMGCQADTLIQVNVNPGLSSSFVYEPAICVAGDELELNSTAAGVNQINWIVNGISYLDTNAINYTIPDSLVGELLSIYSITSNPYGCQDTTLTLIPVNEAILDIGVKQLYLGSQNGQAIIGCELENLGTVPILGGNLFLSVSGIPRLSGSLTDTIMPGNTFYYVFENSPALDGISQNEIEDFLCVKVDLSSVHLNPELTLTNNNGCLLIEEGNFSVSPISPNPLEELGEFALILRDSSEVSIEVLDIMGKRCYYAVVSFESGSHILSLNTASWSVGTYFLRIKIGSEFKISQFIKI